MAKLIQQLKVDDVFANRIKSFRKLMKYKIREILLISSLYDFYLFEEDGRLYELIRKEYQDLNLSHPPEITHVTSGIEAIELASMENHYDLIITTLHIEDMHVHKFAKMLRQASIQTPVIVLAYDNQEKDDLILYYDISVFEKIFIWQGDYRLLIAIIKYIEDKLNVANDSIAAGVQSIIVIEDNVKYYSAFLPIIYSEILIQTQRLLQESVNLTHKFIRMRARPKILLCSTFEEAWSYFERYEEYIIGVITDIDYPMNGIKNCDAGLIFSKKVKERHDDIPILIQSSNTDGKEKAEQIGVSFLQKSSNVFLKELRKFILKNFGFGDFYFKSPDGTTLAKATDLKSLEEEIRKASLETIIYHASRNHFSNWLKARTEFWLAQRLRPVKVTDFESANELRNQLADAVKVYQELQQIGIVTEFVPENFNPKNTFARIGNGSLGGKARGLAFINSIISSYNIRNKFENVEISVPSSVVIATDVFDRFMERNNLLTFALNCYDDIEIMRRFVSAEYFPEDIIIKLKEFISLDRFPLAIRSSSLLEDSQYLPFAGVYETYMIPNNNPDSEIRLKELIQSIKTVFASTFFKAAKDYIKQTDYGLEEEKMAVILQRMVGANHNDIFYPEFAGVAKSYNFYPLHPQKSTDGISLVALGLGKTVVDGGNVVRFCPKYPRHLLQFFSTKETIKNAQQSFFALDLHGKLDINFDQTHDMLVHKYELSRAESDNTLYYTGSTYSPENDSVYDGISRIGKRVVSFAPILKHKIFPLPEILQLILELGTWGMGTAVEIEFAVNMTVPPKAPKEFAILQMRPLVMNVENEELEITYNSTDELICATQQVLGNGVLKDIYDIIYIDYDKYDRGKSIETAAEVAYFNKKLVEQKRPYILIGVGRWGSLDHWLGIPVSWDQISGAKVIVESGFKDFSVTPSQGSHFFQNITSLRIGYLTVNSINDMNFIKWQWLREQNFLEEKRFTRHIQFNQPITVRLNSHLKKGIILKPGINPN